MTDQNKLDAAIATQALLHPYAKAAALNHARPDAKSETEAWLSSLGTRFADVFFMQRNRTWFDERHVADPETLATTIDMTASRLGAAAAMWADPDSTGWWLWIFKAGPASDNARLMPTREAAEMYAIHRG